MNNSTNRKIIPKLIKAPVKEAICEIRCDISKAYSLLPGGLYESIKNSFPTVAELPFANINGPIPDELKFIAAHRFVSAKKDFIAQIGPKLCSVNALDPYAGFETFSSHITAVFEAYKRVAEPNKLHRIGLRYINLIPSATSKKIEDYVNVDFALA